MLADTHFQIAFDIQRGIAITPCPDCQMRWPSSMNPASRDERDGPVARGGYLVQSGDTFEAGQVIFSCTCLGQPVEASRPLTAMLSLPSTESSKDLRATVDSRWNLGSEQIAAAGLSDQAQAYVGQSKSLRNAIDCLQTHNLMEDAVRLLAACLPAHRRIAWCIAALSAFGIPCEPLAHQRIQAWLASSQEPARQEAAAIVDWQRRSDPWTWVLAAISWTGGSLAPANAPPVPPSDDSVVAAIIGSLQLAACHTDPTALRRWLVDSGLEQLEVVCDA